MVAPVITSNSGGATATINVAENTTAVTTVTATDVDANTTLIYSISGGVDAALFQINAVTGALSFIAAPNFEAATDVGANNVYDVVVQVSDGTLTDTQAIAVTVTNVNEATLHFGTVAGVSLNLIAPFTTVNGKTYYLLDLNNDGLSSSADFIGHDKTDLLFNNGSDTYDTQPNGAVAGVDDARTIVIDGYTIIQPTFAEIVALRNETNLIFPEGWQPIDYDSPNIPSATLVGANVHYNVSFKSTQLYTNLYDGYGYNGSLFVQVIAPENTPPTITSNSGGATATINVAENTTAVTTVTATDVDANTTLSYSISGGADAARFAINAATGALSFIAAPNFEAATDVGANNVYDVVVQVSDGTLTDTQAIAVTVTNANEAPTITSNSGGATAAVNVTENTTAVITVTATDVDASTTLAYSISGGADAARFAINAVTGALSFIAAPNFEAPTDSGANNVYDVVVQVSDGTLTDTQAIAVTVTNVNEAPAGSVRMMQSPALPSSSITDSSTQFYWDPAQGGNGHIYEFVTVSGLGLSWDEVRSAASNRMVSGVSGYLATVTSAAEDAAIYSRFGQSFTKPIPLGANDAAVEGAWRWVTGPEAGTQFWSGRDATSGGVPVSNGYNNWVGVEPNNNFPYLGDPNDYLTYFPNGYSPGFDGGWADDYNWSRYTAYIVEYSANLSAAAINLNNGTMLYADASLISDPDGIGTINWQWQRSTDSGLSWINIPTATQVSYALSPADEGHMVRLSATYTDGGGSVETLYSGPSQVAPENTPPVITTNSGGATAALAVTENTTLVTIVTATDVDASTTLIYSISGGVDAALFQINAVTGALSFIAAPNFEAATDVGANNVYDVVVQVSDGTLTDTQAIAVTVTNANEATLHFGTVAGVNLNLIKPFTTANGKTYYLLDLNNDGLSSSADFIGHDKTDLLFNNGSDTYDTQPNGAVAGVDDARTIVIDGYTIIQPTFAEIVALRNETNLIFPEGWQPIDYDSPNIASATLVGANVHYNVSFKSTQLYTNLYDGYGYNGSLFVQVIAPANTPPTITSNSGGATVAVSIAENATAVTIVTATDVDANTTLSYSISGGVDAALFQINAATGTLSFKTAPNFEAPTDAGADNVYDVVVQASDGSLTDTQAIAVTVNNTNESPSLSIPLSPSSGKILQILNQNLINTTTLGAQSSPSLAVLTNGNIVAAWTSHEYNPLTDTYSGDGSGSTLRLRIIGPDGQAIDRNPNVVGQQFSDFIGNETAAGDTDWPSIAPLNGGGFVVTWTLNRQVVAKIFDESGNSITQEFLVNNPSSRDSYLSTVHSLSDGGFVIVWTEYNNIKARTYSQYGEPTNRHISEKIDELGIITVNTTIGHGLGFPVVQEINAGHLFISWQDYDIANNNFSIVKRVIKKGAGEFPNISSDVFDINEVTLSLFGQYALKPDIAKLENGFSILVWYSNGFIFGTLLDQYGNSISPGNGALDVREDFVFRISDVVEGAQWPQVAATADQGFIVSWHNSSGPVSYRTFNASAVPTSPVVNAKQGTVTAIASMEDGSSFLLWTTFDSIDGSSSAIGGSLLISDVTASLSTAENTTAVTTVTATDVDANTTLSYSISGGVDAALFDIDTATGALSFIAAPNFEAASDSGANNVYDVIVQVSDGTLTDTQAIAVTVTNANEAPVITSNSGGATAAINIAENTTAVTTVTATDVDASTTLSYSISGGVDAALFQINAVTGALSFIAAPNFEAASDSGTNNVYDVIVQVSDGTLTDTQAIAVTVTNTNEAPTITSNSGGATAAINIAENTTAVTTVTATDVDASTTLSYSISGGVDAALFQINAATGALSFIAAPNFEAASDSGANNVYDVVVQVSDGALTDTQAIAVTVTNANEAPVITSNTGGATAAVNVAENTMAVTTVTSTDVDASTTLSYSISGGVDAALFDIDAATGALSFKTTPNFEAATDVGVNNVYDVIVQVSDGTLTDTQAIAVTVTNANEAPVVTSNSGGATAAISIAENTTAVTAVTATDVDASTTLSYSISGGVDAALFDIDAATGALSFKTAPNFEAAGDVGTDNIYDVIVQVSDGSLTDTQAIAVTVTNANEAPVITSNSGGATAAVNVTENTTAVTTVTATDVDASTTLSYSISGGVDAALFQINAVTGALSFIAAPNFEAASDSGVNNVYDVIVDVSDGTLTDTQAIAVTVTNVNEAPVITSNSGGATAAVNVTENTTAVTTVTATDVDASTTLSYSISGGVDAALFQINAVTGALSFIAAPNFEAASDSGANNVYDVVVQVSDGTLTDTQAIAVTVTNANEAPTITSNSGGATAAVNVTENTTAVTTVAATDVDASTTLSYSISGGVDAALFQINAVTGALSFITAPNFEAAGDSGANNVYDVIVQVSDGTLTDTQAIAVTVTNANEAPTITSNSGGATAAANVTENTTAVTTVTATDVDASTTLSYSISGGADAAQFAINAATGALSFITAPNFEAPADNGANNVYDVIVQVSDGTLTDTQAIAVTVTNANEAPAITSNSGGATAAVNVTENTTAVTSVAATDVDATTTLSYSISGGVDAARFAINAITGVLSFIAAPNFEAPTDVGANNVYDVIVQVSDGTLTDTQAIAVTVTNANEAPTITSNSGGVAAAVNVTENTTAVSTVTATDVDASATLSYSISGGADAARFAINAATGALSFITAPNFEAPTDVGANNVYDVIVQVSDGTLTDTQAIAVTVTNANEAPTITSNTGGATAVVSIAENTTAVTTVTAADVDASTTLSYSISGGVDAARFAINTATGALSFIAAPNFEAASDSGANNVYDVIVQVSDGTLIDTQAIAVTVTNANEAPTITSNSGGATASLSVAENITAVTTVIAADVDASTTLSYSISGGADAARFAINAATGALSFIAAPNFEAATDVGTDNVYDVIVQVSDGTLIDTQAIAVTVTNANEAPVITSNSGGATAAVSIAENTTAVTTVTATDVDANTTLSYSISGGADAARFAINAVTGALSFIPAPNFEAPADVGANNVYDVIVQVSDGSLTDTQAIAVTVTDVDEIAPTLLSASPVDGAIGFSASGNVAFTFSEAIQRGTGLIELRAGSAAGTVVESFDAANSARITISGATLTIDPTAVLGSNTRYFVTIPSGAIRDLAGNAYAGVTTYDFTTAYNLVNGTASADVLAGTASDDQISGLAGNDTLRGNAGNDLIAGGAGVDLATYSTNFAQAQVTRNADKSLAITTSLDGADTVTGVEQFRFSDGLYSFTFRNPGPAVIANFNAASGWASQDQFPRHVADMNGDSYADVVGFGFAGTFVSYGSAAGTFSGATLVLSNFGQTAGWTSDNQFHREVVDVNGDGRADIVGFGQAGTLVSLARSDGSFADPILGVANFGVSQGWATQDGFARTLGDVNGDGFVDIVGFGFAGTLVSLGNGNGTFQPVQTGIANFGVSQGWSSDNAFHRAVADVTGDGRDDIIGFGIAGTFVAVSKGDGTFDPAQLVLNDFGANQGWSSDDKFSRLLADVNGDDIADIVGFGIAGTLISFGKGDGTFFDASFDLANFGANQGWNSDNNNHRTIADMNNDGLADIVGFGIAGVLVGLNDGTILL